MLALRSQVESKNLLLHSDCFPPQNQQRNVATSVVVVDAVVLRLVASQTLAQTAAATSINQESNSQRDSVDPSSASPRIINHLCRYYRRIATL